MKIYSNYGNPAALKLLISAQFGNHKVTLDNLSGNDFLNLLYIVQNVVKRFIYVVILHMFQINNL